MLLPACTGLGEPLLVIAKSQSTVTGVVTVVLLLAEFGSIVVAVTEEFAVMEAAVTLEGTLTTTMMSAEAPEARVGSVQLTLPVPPTAGVVHVHPTGAETEANVVFVGVASVKLAPEAALGPLLVIVCV